MRLYDTAKAYKRLEEIQKLALEDRNLTAALRAEELKGKMFGLYSNIETSDIKVIVTHDGK